MSLRADEHNRPDQRSHRVADREARPDQCKDPVALVRPRIAKALIGVPEANALAPAEHPIHPPLLK
jgi:hypothetical protein